MNTKGVAVSGKMKIKGAQGCTNYYVNEEVLEEIK